MPPMMRRRTQGRACPLQHGDGKCEMSGEAALVERGWEDRRWRREAAGELAEEAEEITIREALAEIRESYRRPPDPDPRPDVPVIGRGQFEVPPPEVLARVHVRRLTRGIGPT